MNFECHNLIKFENVELRDLPVDLKIDTRSISVIMH